MTGDFDTRERRDMRETPDRFRDGKWSYRPMAPNDRIRFMARHSGYVMVRKPGARPFVMTEKEWLKLPPFADAPSPSGDGR